LFLGELPTKGGWFGLSLIIFGLLLNGLGGLHMSRTGSLQLKGFASALLIALLISTYTLIDGAAVKRTQILPYALAVFALIPLPITPFILRRYGWERLKYVWNNYNPGLVLIGFLGVAAYLFALWAYAIAPLNYSGAIREVTVVMGAFVGWRFLGEKIGGLRLTGALAIFIGILLILALA
jgi:drug/metabolite transporter (DMT)-like permease